MCGGGYSAPPPQEAPPPPPAPTAPSPSASALPDASAYTEASRRKNSAKSQRGQLRIELGTGGGKSVGTGINTNQ
jgi:hypothetical protein